MHREKLEVQGYVKDNGIKQCKKKVINTYNRVPPIITRVNMLFFLDSTVLVLTIRYQCL